MLRNNVEYAQLIKRHRAKTSLIAAMIGNFLWEYKLLYFLKILLLVAADSLRLECLVTTFWLYRYSKKILDRGFAYRYKNAQGAVTRLSSPAIVLGFRPAHATPIYNRKRVVKQTLSN